MNQDTITPYTEPILQPRFNSTGTCADKPYDSFIVGLFTKIQDSFFYVNVLQFAIVSLMYFNVGKGRYWKILFIAALAGFLGCLIENSEVAYLCREAIKNEPKTWQVPFFLTEFFWVIEEYSIPFLNLTKMKAFSKGKLAKTVNYLIMGLFPIFVACRFFIGYQRMKHGVLTTKETKYGHAAAFGVMAISDLICTFAILYFVRKHNSQEAIKSSNITNYIKRSSYIILIFVDVVGILLAVANMVTEHFGLNGSLVNPLHCIKCSFILILASDALLFKYSVNTSSAHESSGNYKYPGDSYNYSSGYKNNSFNRSRNHYETNYNNKSKSQNNSSNYYNELSGYQTKSIIKNYTNNIKPSSNSTYMYENSPDSDKTYPTQNFGFLYQNRDY